jgi:hypothetical protein
MESALDVVVHLGRSRSGARRLHEVALPTRLESGLVQMECAYRYADGYESRGPAAARLEQRVDRSTRDAT